MNGKSLRILLIDDDKDELLITQGLLTQVSGTLYDLQWASNYDAGLEALRHGGHDACLLDYRLGAHDGLELLRQAQALGCRVPIIMLTGQGDQAIDLQAMKAGAADYLIKEELDAAHLERSIRYAIERHQLMVKLGELAGAEHQARLDYQKIAAQLREANDILETRVHERTAGLTAALKEKEVLLRELHHRVKNNLQIITSLLSLEGSRAQDRAAQQLFKECQQRVRVIAMVHEKLYRAANLASLDLAGYFRNLVHNLLRFYSLNPGAVTSRITVDEDALGIDELIPCALIVHELVCNSLKYAFPDSRAGEIRVEIQRRNGDVALVVADDGVGVATASRRGSGAGQQIVQALVDQLSGQMTLASGRGTTITVIFPGHQRDAGKSHINPWD